MKLVIQIATFNEAEYLGLVIDDLRENLTQKDFDSVEIIVVDDGSEDSTLEVAKKKGIKHIVDLGQHRGLGIAYREGLRHALELGADIIVNTDADFQYRACEIDRLVKPILDNKADMVIGDRQIKRFSNYPTYKYMSQIVGNFLVSKLFCAEIKDVTSGFRAYSKDVAKILVENTVNTYTYTAESVCVLLNKNMRILFMPITINTPLRKSRLIKNKVYYAQNFLFTVFKHYFRRKRLQFLGHVVE